MNRKKYVEPIPSWALYAIINDDRTGLEDDDIRQIEDWFAETGYDLVCPPNDEDEGYFTPCPAFGLPCDVYDCVCIKFV